MRHNIKIQSLFEDDSLFLAAALKLLARGIIWDQLSWCGFYGGGISSSYGGYVADPPNWDGIRPLRKLKSNEVAAWSDERVVIFAVDDIRDEIVRVISKYPVRANMSARSI